MCCCAANHRSQGKGGHAQTPSGCCHGSAEGNLLRHGSCHQRYDDELASLKKRVEDLEKQG